MSYFLTEQSKSGMKFGRIILTEEEEEMFKECGYRVSGQNKSPSWSDNVMKYILGDIKIDEINL